MLATATMGDAHKLPGPKRAKVSINNGQLHLRTPLRVVHANRLEQKESFKRKDEITFLQKMITIKQALQICLFKVLGKLGSKLMNFFFLVP